MGRICYSKCSSKHLLRHHYQLLFSKIPQTRLQIITIIHYIIHMFARTQISMRVAFKWLRTALWCRTALYALQIRHIVLEAAHLYWQSRSFRIAMAISRNLHFWIVQISTTLPLSSITMEHLKLITIRCSMPRKSSKWSTSLER